MFSIIYLCYVTCHTQWAWVAYASASSTRDLGTRLPGRNRRRKCCKLHQLFSGTQSKEGFSKAVKLFLLRTTEIASDQPICLWASFPRRIIDFWSFFVEGLRRSLRGDLVQAVRWVLSYIVPKFLSNKRLKDFAIRIGFCFGPFVTLKSKLVALNPLNESHV